MTHPEYIYYGAMVMATLLVLFNRLAAVVVIGWAIAQIASRLLDLEGAQMVALTGMLDLVSLAVSIAWVNRPENASAIGLFAPMAAIHTQEFVWWSSHGDAGIHPYHAYWIIYALALLQATLLPLGTDWKRAKATVQAYRRKQVITRALRFLPC